MFEKGQKVHWEDPEGKTSGTYIVEWDQARRERDENDYPAEPDDIIALRDESGTEVEALRHEVSATVEIFPDLRSKIVFSVQTERSELLRGELDRLGEPTGGLQQMEEMALGLAINLIEDRLKYAKEVKRLKEKAALLLVKELEVTNLLDRSAVYCSCGEELGIFDDSNSDNEVDVYCEKCEFEMRVEV